MFEGGFRDLVGEDRVLNGQDGGSWDAEKKLVFFYALDSNFKLLACARKKKKMQKVSSSAQEIETTTYQHRDPLVCFSDPGVEFCG